MVDLNKFQDLLEEIDLEQITSDSSNYDEVPDGYYLVKLVKAEFTTSKSDKEMVKWEFETTRNGVDDNSKDPNAESFIELVNTKGIKMWMYNVIEDKSQLKNLISNILKFENEKGESIVEKTDLVSDEAFELVFDSLIGETIYISAKTSKNKDGEDVQWKRMMTWKQADKIGLKS